MYRQWNIKTDLIGPVSVIFNEKIEEFYKDYGDGNVSNNWD